MPTKYIPQAAWQEIVRQENGNMEQAHKRVKDAVRREAGQDE